MSHVNYSQEEMTLDLRSGQSNHSHQGGSTGQSRGPVVAETELGEEHSQQLMSPVSQPSQFRTAQSNQERKEGLELTDPPDVVGYTSHTLPQSRFLASGQSDPVPDDVFLEKQRAQEEALVGGKLGGGEITGCEMTDNKHREESMRSSWKTCTEDKEDYRSYPVQDSGSLNRENNVTCQGETARMDSTCSMDTGTSHSSVDMGLSLGSSISSGTQPTSMIHQTSDEMTWQNNPALIIRPEEYPAQFKEGQFDCVLIYSENDAKMAVRFKDMLQKFVVLEDHRAPEICILDRNDNLQYIQSRFKHADEAMDRSTYMFLFITEDFVGDAWADMQKDECLMESIRCPEKKWCVVPLHTQKKKTLKFRYPYGLRALKGVDISAILPGKRLEVLDVNKLSKEEVDSYFLDNITKMFNQRLGHKIERQKKQDKELQSWIYAEQERRFKQLILEEQRAKVERLRREQERVNLQKALDRDTEQVRLRLEQMEVPTIGNAKNIDAKFNLPDMGEGGHKPPAGGATVPAEDPLQMIRTFLELRFSLPEAVNLVRKQLGKAPIVISFEPKKMTMQLLDLGIAPLTAAQLAQQHGKGLSGPEGAGATYHITNYGGNVQVGGRNVQRVENKPNEMDEHNNCDSGVEFEVRESSSLNVDATSPQPSGDLSQSRPLLPPLTSPSATSSNATHRGLYTSTGQRSQGQGQNAAPGNGSGALFPSNMPSEQSAATQMSNTSESTVSIPLLETSLTGQKVRFNENIGRNIQEDVSEGSVRPQNFSQQRMGVPPMEFASGTSGSDQGQSSTSRETSSYDLESDHNQGQQAHSGPRGQADSGQCHSASNGSSVFSRSGQGQNNANNNEDLRSQEYNFLCDREQADSGLENSNMQC